MKRILFLLLFIFSLSIFASFSKDLNAKIPNDSTTCELGKVSISSSHTLRKKADGYITGDSNITIENENSAAIESVEVILKSSNQPSITIAKLDYIQGNGHLKTTGRFYMTDIQYPYLVCTFTYNGKSYTKEYSY